jgi:hypothetical protein
MIGRFGFEDSERMHLNMRNAGILGAKPTLSKQELRQIKALQIVMLWLFDDGPRVIAHGNRDEFQGPWKLGIDQLIVERLVMAVAFDGLIGKTSLA